ncbi:MAG: urease accessory protein UreF [Rhodobacter sp.]|nr:urease accessory protein UreF [Rhodobacter sp.]MCA3492681.1 urease accessory protein UreF [Rhodobacter sp.]MCA3498479.1 urease accessory protein UreF [Rhodobacter sp.]MCA3504148.1 urease accessory protein UreF [Rhodobacter sp.]MCA3515547.1 urease accessory protein UreF [Rhodobacter sp.]
MTDAALLCLTQWLSPAFPAGSYAYSHGLEWAISDGDVTTAAQLQCWIAAVLTEGAGRTDAILLAQALRPETDLADLAALAQALAASGERLVETLDQGRALGQTIAALTGRAEKAMPYPVALGAAARDLGLPVARVAALYLHAFASTLVQAGVRFVPLGQTEGQAVLAALHPVILQVAQDAACAGIDRIGSGALRSDLAGMHHETMNVRIFRT